MNDILLGLRPLQKFVAKHHPVLFLCLIMALLAVAVYVLYDVMKISEATPSSSQSSTIPDFDRATIDKIKKLHDSTDTGESLTYPTSRANPFIE